MNNLELDFSEIEWDTEIISWDNSWIDLDFSEFEKKKDKDEENKKDWENKEDWNNQEDFNNLNNSKDNNSENENKLSKEWNKWWEWNNSWDEDFDSTLNEIEGLLAWLDEDSDNTLDEIEGLLAWLEEDDQDTWEVSRVLEQLRLDNSQQNTTIDQLKKLISKLNKEKGDIMMRNTELELYWNIDDPNLVYLSWNLEKAKWGDERSKNRIVSILDNLRAELVWKTKDEEDLENETDIISKVSSFNNSSNPNTKIRWWLEEFQIDL